MPVVGSPFLRALHKARDQFVILAQRLGDRLLRRRRLRLNDYRGRGWLTTIVIDHKRPNHARQSDRQELVDEFDANLAIKSRTQIAMARILIVVDPDGLERNCGCNCERLWSRTTRGDDAHSSRKS